MFTINIKVTRETLQELRGHKDVWSEVVFRDGYELAPTYALVDIARIDTLLLAPTRESGWETCGRDCAESNSIPFTTRPSTSMTIGGLAWDNVVYMAEAA